VLRAELRGPRSDVAVLLTTFVLTVLVDLTVAIEVGMVRAAFLFMRRMSEVASVSLVTPDSGGDGDIHDIPPSVSVYEIDGPFFFGAAETFRETMHELAERPTVLVLRLRHVPVIDSTGLHALHDLVRRCASDGTRVILSGVTPGLRETIERSPLGRVLEPAQVFGDFEAAVAEARRQVHEEIEGRTSKVEGR
jgi:SulP family sulfate permease